MPAGDVEYILSRIRSTEPRPSRSVGVAADPGSGQAGGDEESRRRRHIAHEWPETGIVFSAEYYGERCTAKIIPATKRLKSGKQIRITSGPARGDGLRLVFRSHVRRHREAARRPEPRPQGRRERLAVLGLAGQAEEHRRRFERRRRF